MSEPVIIHIEWEGPYSLAEIKNVKKFGRPPDKGVYQVYGGHPIYGGSQLLYIGMACEQTFAQRLLQEKQWIYNRHSKGIEIHVGRLADQACPVDEDWNALIKKAERLLIAAHYPPYNSQKKLGGLDEDLWLVHVLNWRDHRDLLPEVSGSRWSNRLNEIKGYRVFGHRNVVPGPTILEKAG